MRRLVALLATTARAQTPRRVHGFDVRTKAGHAFKCLDAFIAPAPWNASAPALIGVCHPGHRQLTWAGGRCGFRYASTEMDARVASVSGAPTMTWPRWLGRAVRNRHRHAIEQASRRWRGGRRGDSDERTVKF